MGVKPLLQLSMSYSVDCKSSASPKDLMAHFYPQQFFPNKKQTFHLIVLLVKLLLILLPLLRAGLLQPI